MDEVVLTNFEKEDFTMKRQSGFTLIELMIVVAVIGVIAMVGFPLIEGYSWKTYRLDECKNQLYERSIALAAHKDRTGSYTVDMAAINYSEFSREDDIPNSKYTFTIAPGTTSNISNSFLLTCARTAANNDTDCGDLTLDNFGREGMINPTAYPRTVEDCWR